MITAKHTPGPWTATGFRQMVVNAPSGDTLCLAPATASSGLDEIAANARLIAAAPELLASLEAVLDDLEEAHQPETDADHHGDPKDECIYCRNIAQARAAIAKATEGPA